MNMLYLLYKKHKIKKFMKNAIKFAKELIVVIILLLPVMYAVYSQFLNL